MPSRATVEQMISAYQIPTRRLPAMVTTSIDLSLTHATHAGKVVRTTVKNIDQTLPLATQAKRGEVYTMLLGVDSDAAGANSPHLKVTSADKINSGTSGKGLKFTSLSVAGESVTVVSDGSDWWTIASHVEGVNTSVGRPVAEA